MKDPLSAVKRLYIRTVYPLTMFENKRVTAINKRNIRHMIFYRPSRK
jgi:hypothetical protein